MMRVLLNGAETSPSGVDSLTEELFLSEDFFGYIYQITGTITFHGPDHDTLRTMYDAAYCQDVNIEIQRAAPGASYFITVAKGIIKLAGIKWDLVQRQAECPITDNSFLSRINTNKSIKFLLGDNLFKDVPIYSKNGVDVTYKYVIQEDIQLFSPLHKRFFEDEAYFDDLGGKIDMRPAGRKGMFICDALNLIIAMMTDDECDFISDYFTYNLITPASSNAEAFGVLLAGSNVRSGIGVPYISFEDFFSDLHRVFNVYFSIEKSPGGKPRIRVEPESYYKQINSNTYFEDVKSVVEGIDLKKIYSKIVLGCSKQDISFPIEDVPLVLHGQEEYGLSGNCNVDNTLELRLTNLVINTNSIALTLPPISGFNKSNSVIRKYTTDECDGGSAGHNQQIDDFAADFRVHGVQRGFILQDTVENEWSYVTKVTSNDNILIWDIILLVDATGLIKNYQIYQPAVFESYDEDVFLIQIDRGTATSSKLYAHSTNITLPDVWYYNDLYSNANVILRHTGGLAQNIINQISNGNDEFEAAVIAANVGPLTMTVLNDEMYRAVPFDDDVNTPYFDTNNNYDPATGFYIVPQAGYYHAHCEVNIRNETPVDGGIQLSFQVGLSHLSATGDVIDVIEEQGLITSLGNATFTLDKLFSCDPGDRICVVVKRPYNEASGGTYPLQYIPWIYAGILIRHPSYTPAPPVTSTFGIDELFNGGGVLQPSEPDEVRLFLFESELTIPRDIFDAILANPFNYYHLHYGQNKYLSGFIENVSRGIENGDATIKIIKRKNTI